MSGLGSNVITAHMLKLKTGEFDLESIHHLDLRNMGIQDLSVIGQCTGLVNLNLSSNKITSLRQLGELKLLENLDLSCNKISSLDGLEGLTSLSSLNLTSNMIMSIDELKCLSQLEKLVKIRLQDCVHKQSNPVCQTTGNYKQAAQKILPHLKVLDGERLSGSGGELYTMCDEMEAVLEEYSETSGQPLAFRSMPWNVDKLYESSKSPNRSFDEAQLGFEEVLSHCRKLNEEAVQSVKDADDALWSASRK